MPGLLLLCLSACLWRPDCPCYIDQEGLKHNAHSVAESAGYSLWVFYGLRKLKYLEGETYRLFVMPALSEQTIYTLQRDQDSISLSVQYYNQMDLYPHRDSLDRQEIYAIPLSDWESVNQIADSACLWTMKPYSGYQSRDGTKYLLEMDRLQPHVCTEKNYHLIGRTTGEDEPGFFALSRALITLTEKNKRRP